MTATDPLDVSAGTPRPRPSSEFIRGLLTGLGRADRHRRRERRFWLAVAVLLVAYAFLAGRVSAAPRPAQVIPSAPLGAASSDPERTGAPLGSTGPSVETNSPRPSISVAGGAPSPTAATIDPATGTNPAYTPEPERTPAVRVSRLSNGIAGPATWFAQAPYGTAAAGPRLRRLLGAGWRGMRVAVSRPGCGCPPVILVLTDWCACTPPGGPARLIDLDDQAFAALAPLSFGVIDVVVRVIGR